MWAGSSWDFGGGCVRSRGGGDDGRGGGDDSGSIGCGLVLLGEGGAVVRVGRAVAIIHRELAEEIRHVVSLVVERRVPALCVRVRVRVRASMCVFVTRLCEPTRSR